VALPLTKRIKLRKFTIRTCFIYGLAKTEEELAMVLKAGELNSPKAVEEDRGAGDFSYHAE
jgi:dsDNA-binding SOS-regulon protein